MEQFQEIAAQLGIDQSFYTIFITIVVLYFLLSAIYLKPYQKLLEHRRKRTEGAKKEAQDLLAKSEKAFSHYKTQLKEANQLAKKYYNEAEEEARKEESKILSKASEKVRSSLKNAQIDLENQKKSVLETLSGEISGFAAEIAAKVLGRSLGNRLENR